MNKQYCVKVWAKDADLSESDNLNTGWMMSFITDEKPVITESILFVPARDNDTSARELSLPLHSIGPFTIHQI